MARKILLLVPGFFCSLSLGCLFDAAGAKNLACSSSSDCGDLSCIRGLCQESGWNPLAPKNGPEGGAGCIAYGSPCASASDCCGGICYDWGDGVAVCSPPCDWGGDCESCCCRPFSGSEGQYVGAFCGYPDECGTTECGTCGRPQSQCFADEDCCDGRCFNTNLDIQLCFASCEGPGAACDPGYCCVAAPVGEGFVCDLCG